MLAKPSPSQAVSQSTSSLTNIFTSLTTITSTSLPPHSDMASTSTHLGFSAFLAFAFPSPFTCNLAAREERSRQRKLARLGYPSEKC
ncbi:hypothetical protein CALVIDRAFT_600505 [Calocera viscosa TUFC12733]|uniref:Uncharacterized protein n=1 Tax=Calocera viscosa (strain TUFC12733) TaxID=1330018 RepID=A0A167JQ09_CALVF|nr:hypothetical protein CALVIDRAFT_600505 [Calocera viscosa TUFC12733]